MVYYIGYKCPWAKYPSSKFLDGDEHEVKLIDTSPEARLIISTSKRSQYLLGCAIVGEYVPTVMQWTSRPVPTDYDTPGGFPCISAAMKSIIEQFEPDVHQFFPLKVVNKTGEEIAQRWLWVVCNRIDSVDREHTTYKLVNGATWMSNYLDGNARVRVDGAILYFSNKQSAGYHFWRDKHLMASNGILCSDEAAQALQSANLSALAIGPARSI